MAAITLYKDKINGVGGLIDRYYQVLITMRKIKSITMI